MHILLDIDSTTFDTHSLSLRFVNKHFGTSYKSEDVDDWENPTRLAYDHNIWRWSPECFEHPEFSCLLAPLDGARSVVYRLLAQGHDVSFVTDRPAHMYELTRELLNRHGFRDVPVYFTQAPPVRNKITVAQELGMDTIVEDSGKHALKLAKDGRRVLLLDYPYNRHVHHENITRVHSWKEIEALLCA